jgi:Domain of unknown function (DUF4345)
MSRTLLQILTALLALVPIATGIAGILLGPAELRTFSPISTNDPQHVLDSNYRYFSGLWLALGLCLLYTVRSIEYNGLMFRLVWGAIFIGGIGRAISMIQLGMPPPPFIGFTALELIGAPIFIAWQASIAKP